jgi:hypothetical protein
MSRATPPITEALAAVQGLTPEQILTRLDELHAEERQLRILLRAARARERALRRIPVDEGGGPQNAA